MNQIYTKDNFIIFRVDDNFIVANTLKAFKQGHTHIKNLSMCKTLIDLAQRKKMPRSHNGYLLQSLCRISDDLEYVDKIQQLITTRKCKGRKEPIRKRRSD